MIVVILATLTTVFAFFAIIIPLILWIANSFSKIKIELDDKFTEVNSRFDILENKINEVLKK